MASFFVRAVSARLPLRASPRVVSASCLSPRQLHITRPLLSNRFKEWVPRGGFAPRVANLTPAQYGEMHPGIKEFIDPYELNPELEGPGHPTKPASPHAAMPCAIARSHARTAHSGIMQAAAGTHRRSD